MPLCFFVSDLHGFISRYEKLFAAIATDRPEAVFIGGDILPSGTAVFMSAVFPYKDFLNDFLAVQFGILKDQLRERYPRVFVIMGNDDGRFEEDTVVELEDRGIWEYIHNRKVAFGDFTVYGYNYVPPTPFLLKDWERYDVSRFVDPGCVSPEEGARSLPVSDHEKKFTTIQKDLELLAGEDDLSKAIFLFHTPPYKTNLDRAALDGKKIDHVELDPYVGSIAVRRFIENRRPYLTLHGHIHESAELTGNWRDQIDNTPCFSAAHNGPELALVRFDPMKLQEASRELL